LTREFRRIRREIALGTQQFEKLLFHRYVSTSENQNDRTLRPR
jgi:hypothetical protein